MGIKSFWEKLVSFAGFFGGFLGNTMGTLKSSYSLQNWRFLPLNKTVMHVSNNQYDAK